MPFPKQQRFTIKDLAAHWNKSESYIAELIRKEQFPYVIVQGERLGGVPVTRHIFYDRAFLLRKGGDFSRHLTPEERDEAKNCNYIDMNPQEFINICKRTQKDDRWWSSYNALDQGTIYIPAISVKYFEQKHGLQREVNAENAEIIDKDSVPDISEILPARWYRTSQTARFLGVKQKYLQNNLIHKLPAKKVRGQWLVQGETILAHIEQNGARV